MEPSRWYFTKSCAKITTHATITDEISSSVFTVAITDGHIRRYCTESFEIFTDHATITDGKSVGDYRWNTDGIISSVKFSREIVFLACSPVCNTVGVWFFFISYRVSDGTRNYWRSIFQQTDSIGDTVN